MYNSQLIIVLLVGAAFLTTKKVRGLRNNNPLNIKFSPSNNFIGQIGQDSKGFAVFSAPVYGLRAAFKVLNTYLNKNINTIETIVKRFSETDQKYYIQFLSDKLGITPNTKIDYSMLPNLIHFMSKMETGIYQPMSLVLQAEKMAA